MSISLVNLVHSSGEGGDFLPLNFRVYAPDADELTKNEHFQAMFAQVVSECNLLISKVYIRAVLRLVYWSSGSPLFWSGAGGGVPPLRHVHEPENRCS